MKTLRQIALKYKALFFANWIVGVAVAFLSNYSARFYQRLIDRFTDGSLGLFDILLYGSVLLSMYVISYLEEYPFRKLESSITLDLKVNALKKVSTIDPLAYQRIGTGTLIQRIENGAAAGTGILFHFILRLAAELLPAMLFSLAFIASISRTVVAGILVGYVVVFLISNLLLKFLYRIKNSILVNEEKFNHVLVRGLMELVVFRVKRRYGREIARAEAAKEEIVSSQVRMKMIHEAFFALFAVLVGVIKIAILLYAWQTKALTIGAAIALITLVENAYQPVAVFNVLYVEFRLNRVAYARYTEFLGQRDDKRLLEGDAVSSLRGDIEIKGAQFRYGTREIFRGLDLVIRQGEKAAFVGESGSGKSTLARLLAGLLEAGPGQVTVGGHDVAKVDLHSYYGHMEYIPQESPVFDGTLRENLVFDEAVEDSAILEALHRVALGELLAKLPHGLETELGERGVTLSGGERQRLAMARLWFSRADIVILDEATSALDSITEEAALANVMELLADRTVIFIAHRMSTLPLFGRIYAFRDGEIAGAGSFDELMEGCGYFRELYQAFAETE